ncbi:MAG: sugar-binding transcriptional regulator [Candidatus Marinimicrobia bacterium]|nr:sugar-binding transcriptional regulator [Candidatus Neomarinimicrobiota bacterium]MBL7047465.1 sugar-binding transcriptional regulator [Candidatus Neomarinimicrobiota bacterium]
MPLERREISILVEAARYYYEHGLTQNQIAKRLGISRPGVSRLLRKARERGIVKIEISDPFEYDLRIEEEIKNKFGLKKVIIVPNGSEDPQVIKRRLGKAAVILLDQIINEGTTFAISWGTTMQEVARQVRRRRVKDMIVVQLNGGISRAEYDTYASEIAQKISDNYEAIPYLLPLPAIVDNPELKRAIISDKNISRTLKLSKKAEVAMFTIGSFSYNSVLVRADYFEDQEVDELLKEGAVGDICSRILKYDGTICSSELNDRTIGIELEELKKKSYSIAVAGGKEKLSAIRAGLNGKWFNVLITDEWVAHELLRD